VVLAHLSPKPEQVSTPTVHVAPAGSASCTGSTHPNRVPSRLKSNPQVPSGLQHP
jgi:hypothetical protein